MTFNIPSAMDVVTVTFPESVEGAGLGLVAGQGMNGRS